MASDEAKLAYPDGMYGYPSSPGERSYFVARIEEHREAYDRGAVDALRDAWKAMSEQGVGLTAETMPKGEFGYQTTLDWLWGLADEREEQVDV